MEPVLKLCTVANHLAIIHVDRQVKVSFAANGIFADVLSDHEAMELIYV